MERPTDSDILHFQNMVNGAERVLEKGIKPWKQAIVGLVVAVVLTNLIWGVVHTYTLYTLLPK